MGTDRINLLPNRKKSAGVSIPNFLTPEVGAIAAFAVIFIFSLFLSLAKRQDMKSKELELKQVTDMLTSTKNQATALGQDPNLEDNAKRNALIQGFAQRKLLLSEILKELSLMTPPQTWLTSVTSSHEGSNEVVTVTAEAPSTKKMNEFLTGLESSYYFRAVHFAFSEQIGKGAREIYRFQFKTEIPPMEFGRAPGSVK